MDAVLDFFMTSTPWSHCYQQYERDNGHELIHIDPYSLGQIPEEEYIPFHCSGLTREFARTIIALCLSAQLNASYTPETHKSIIKKNIHYIHRF